MNVKPTPEQRTVAEVVVDRTRKIVDLMLREEICIGEAVVRFYEGNVSKIHKFLDAAENVSLRTGKKDAERFYKDLRITVDSHVKDGDDMLGNQTVPMPWIKNALFDLAVGVCGETQREWVAWCVMMDKACPPQSKQ